MSHAHLIRYLRDCYLADSRGGGVLDLFAAKIEHRRFLPSPEELLAGTLSPVSVPRLEFEAMAAAAALYRRERSLLYCAFLIVGRAAAPGAGRSSRLCAPLLTYPASLYEEEGFPESLLALAIELGEQRLNFPALVALLGDEGAAAEAAEALLKALPEPPFDAAAVAALAAALGEVLPGVETTPLLAFPDLVGEAEVRRAGRRAARRARQDSMPQCLAACAVALVPRSFETRGVLHELTAIAEVEEPSRPLRRVLGGLEASPASPAISGFTTVPAVLSAAQQRALASASTYPLTLVVGPPGTGKSYTLAAVALDHVARGEPVLIASRSDQALEVVAAKVEQILGERTFTLRGGRGEHLRRLKSYLQQVLHGGLPGLPSEAGGERPEQRQDPAPPRRSRRQSPCATDHPEERVWEIERALERLEGWLRERAALEREWGRDRAEVEAGIASRSPMPWMRRRWLAWRLRRHLPYGQLLERYEGLLEERSFTTAQVLRTALRRQIKRSLAAHRPALQAFLQALKARQSGQQEALFSAIDPAVLLGAFPLWMVSFADLHQVVPLVPEMFALVIVDEATQCDPATCLPALFRGRRAVVSGDPRQLRHVSFLARRRQRTLGKRHGLSAAELDTLDYRAKSLLDLVSEAVTGQDQVVFLDEHFRSTPRIVGFSNREFYQDRLRVMTRRPETEERRSLFVRRVPGRRLEAGHNPQEADVLLDELERRVEEQARLPEELCHSLGVLSPFREQADHLAEETRRRLRLSAIRRHRLLVGTPYAFQGEERDVMLLSLALDPASPARAFLYLERSDVFNVAVTRARNLQVLFCSLAPGEAPAGSLLERYLAWAAEGPQPPDGAGPPHRDRFLGEVRQALERHGCRTWTGYLVAGFAVDLVVARDGASLGLDLIGYPGAFADALDLERCRMLQRAGLRLHPLSFFAWRQDPEGCVAAVLASLR